MTAQLDVEALVGLLEREAFLLYACTEDGDDFAHSKYEKIVENIAQMQAHIAGEDARVAAAVAGASAWRLIETAPKDGSWFVTANCQSHDEYEVGRYLVQMWPVYEPAGGGMFRKVDKLVSEFTHDNFRRATHWHPLVGPAAIRETPSA